MDTRITHADVDAVIKFGTRRATHSLLDAIWREQRSCAYITAHNATTPAKRRACADTMTLLNALEERLVVAEAERLAAQDEARRLRDRGLGQRIADYCAQVTRNARQRRASA